MNRAGWQFIEVGPISGRRVAPQRHFGNGAGNRKQDKVQAATNRSVGRGAAGKGRTWRRAAFLVLGCRRRGAVGAIAAREMNGASLPAVIDRRKGAALVAAVAVGLVLALAAGTHHR